MIIRRLQKKDAHMLNLAHIMFSDSLPHIIGDIWGDIKGDTRGDIIRQKAFSICLERVRRRNGGHRISGAQKYKKKHKTQERGAKE